jgi:hypothetical protein
MQNDLHITMWMIKKHLECVWRHHRFVIKTYYCLKYIPSAIVISADEFNPSYITCGPPQKSCSGYQLPILYDNHPLIIRFPFKKTETYVRSKVDEPNELDEYLKMWD